MRKGLVVGCLLAALAMFVWGFVFWATPLGNLTISQGLDAAKAQEALRGLISSDGVYVVPEPPGGAMDSAWQALHRQGPIATVFYRAAGAAPMAPTVFLLGYLHMLVTCLLIGLVLDRAGAALASNGARTGFVLLVGLAATCWGHVGDPIWLYQPWRFHLMSMVYDLVAWGLAGAILARFARPR